MRRGLARSLQPVLVAAAAVATAAAQEKAVHVDVSLGDVSLNKVAFLIADDAGIYKKHGLDVAQFITPGAADAARRNGVIVPSKYVRAGGGEGADITIGGGIPTIVRMVASGKIDRVILATTDNEARWQVVARPGISKEEQLKGKRLGYSSFGTVSHYMTVAWIQRLGWDPERDVVLTPNTLSIEALKSGLVDAFVADEIVETMAPAAGFNLLVDLRQYHIPMAGSGVNASRSWLRQQPEAARRFMEATVDAIALMKQNQQVAGAAIAKWFGISDPKMQQGIWAKAAVLPRKPYPSVAGIAKLMEMYNTAEMSKHRPEDFHDDSFMKQLDSSGYIDRLYVGAGGKSGRLVNQ
jgi:NitT/TauT family transport system substrate-binding protein